MIRKVIAVISFAASLFMALHAALLQAVTLATNDPHDYQPLLNSGLVWSALSVIVLMFFIELAQKYWRWAVLLPLFFCGIAWWGIARMWPYAFA